MERYQDDTFDLWLEDNNYDVEIETSADEFFPPDEEGWSPSVIEQIKYHIENYCDEKNQNNGDNWWKVDSNNDNNISDMPSEESGASTSQGGDIITVSSSETFPKQQEDVTSSRLAVEEECPEAIQEQLLLTNKTNNQNLDGNVLDDEDRIKNDLVDGDKDDNEELLENVLDNEHEDLEHALKDDNKTKSPQKELKKLKRNPQLLKRNDLYHCEFCEDIFADKKVFEFHLKRKHPTDKKYPCNLCDYSADLKSNLKQHQLTHSKVKDFVCRLCGMSFSRKNDLNRHNESVHLKETYQCEICEKSFSRKSSKQRHMLTTHEKHKAFVCSECGKTFGQSCNLTRHKRMHTGEKLFRCKICSTSFTDSCNLKKHEVIIHTKKLPHNCSICEKGFMCPSRLENHLRTHD